MNSLIRGRTWACPVQRRPCTAHWNIHEYTEAFQLYRADCRSKGWEAGFPILLAHTALGRGLNRSESSAQVCTLSALGLHALLAPELTRAFFEQCCQYGILALAFKFHAEIDCEDELEIYGPAGDVRNISTSTAYRVPPLPPRVRCLLYPSQSAPVPRSAAGRR